MRRLIISIVFLFHCSIIFSQDFIGSWNGVLDYGSGTLRIVFHIEKKDGIYISLMDSPDQGAKGIKTTNTLIKKKNITISMVKQLAVFEGKIKKNTIEGTFTQMGKAMPLVLTRGAIELNRPQDPKQPYPYISEDVYFENTQAGITLAGTLTCPKEGANFPVAILISGSGGQNRDEEAFNHRPFLVLADFLTRQGIAVLRYDDRGVGESKGTYHTATIQDFATDALAAVSYLKTRKEINPNQIGLIGHSEGSSIAFIASTDNEDIAFIVSMAGMAIKGDSLMKLQRYAIAKAANVAEKDFEENEKLVEAMFHLIEKHTADSVFNFPDLFVDEIIPAKQKGNVSVRSFYKKHLLSIASPEIFSLCNYDARTDLPHIHCPLLALNGEKDLQVPADVNLQNFENYFTGNLTLKKYPTLNHLFQHAQTGLVDEYSKIEETISEEVLQDIVKWIKELMQLP